jgi:hypothetical protein
MIKFLPIVHLLAAIVSTWRLTELVTADEIFAKVRAKFPIYLFNCPRCVSVWAGIFTTLMFIVFPYGNWPFAMAWLYLVHLDSRVAKKVTATGRQLVVTIGNGKLMVERNELTPQELFVLRENINVGQEGGK